MYSSVPSYWIDEKRKKILRFLFPWAFFLKKPFCEIMNNSINYIDMSVLLENTQLVNSVGSYIRDTIWIFSEYSLEDIDDVNSNIFPFRSVRSFCSCFCLYNKKKITCWLEDMNYIYSCWKYFHHSKTNFISLHHRVIFSIYYITYGVIPSGIN